MSFPFKLTMITVDFYLSNLSINESICLCVYVHAMFNHIC